MAALLLDLEPGDEVIMPSFTFVSTANAFVLRGAVPVFVDIRPDTLNIDERAVEAAITPRTRAIVVVHYAGVACEMDAIVAIAATARPGRHRGRGAGARAPRTRARPLGGFGDLAAFSFHETKNVISRRGRRAARQRRPISSSAPRSSGRRAPIGAAFFRGERRQVHLDRHRLVVPAERADRRVPVGAARAGRRCDHRAADRSLEPATTTPSRSSSAAPVPAAGRSRTTASTTRTCSTCCVRGRSRRERRLLDS